MPSSVLYPHDTLSGDLSLTLKEVYLDGKSLSSKQIQQVFSIADIGRSSLTDWEEAQLEWILNYEEDTKAESLTDFKNRFGEIRAWLALECRPTNLRLSLKMQPSENSNEWKGTLKIDRELVSGSASVQAWLAYDMGQERIELRHRVASESYPWMIYLDPPRSFHREGGLQMHWIDFSSSEEFAWLKDYSAAFSALDLSPEIPRILLNSAIPGYQDLLTEENSGDPIRETLKTMAAANVSRGPWMAMAQQSLESLKSAGGQLEDWSAPAWQREVLQTLALILGPNQRLRDWIENDGADWIREGLTPANWTKLDVAIGDWISKRSNLATNWQKWSKAEMRAKLEDTLPESQIGLIGRIKKRLTSNRQPAANMKFEESDNG